jgi:CheY-like chemotaxis protein
MRQPLPSGDEIGDTVRMEVPEDAPIPLRVLFVDDEEMLRIPCCRLLAASGYEVVQAEDGVDALEKLNSNSSFDAIITDVRMPRMNGIELLEVISMQHPELSSRAIVISGFVDSSTSLPPHFVLLRKPCDTSHLLDALLACTSRQTRK